MGEDYVKKGWGCRASAGLLGWAIVVMWLCPGAAFREEF